MKALTQARLQEVMEYAPETGVFTWLKPGSNRIQAGARAGVVGANGRRYISVDSGKYMAQRLAWFYVKGEWPQGDIKQKNGDYDDCSFGNLQDISRAQNSQNRTVFSTNTSGFRGVSLSKNGRFQATIVRNYRQLHLGYFDTAEEASAVYEVAAAELEVAVSEEDRSASAEGVKVRRRLRVAWGKLNASGVGSEWGSFDDFVSTVDDVPPRHSIAQVDPTKPLGPLNFKCVADLSTGFDLSTRDGRVAYNRAHRKENPDVYRDRQLRKDFGIGVADYNQMLADQGGVCAICKKASSGVIRKDAETAFHVDHDHETGKVRGLLCGNCNPAIGMLCEDVEILRNAIAYLEKHKTAEVATPGFGAIADG